MTTSNVGCDSIPAVDNVQTSSNIYDDDDDVHSWSIIMPYLGLFVVWASPSKLLDHKLCQIRHLRFLPT